MCVHFYCEHTKAALMTGGTNKIESLDHNDSDGHMLAGVRSTRSKLLQWQYDCGNLIFYCLCGLARLDESEKKEYRTENLLLSRYIDNIEYPQPYDTINHRNMFSIMVYAILDSCNSIYSKVVGASKMFERHRSAAIASDWDIVRRHFFSSINSSNALVKWSVSQALHLRICDVAQWIWRMPLNDHSINF